MIEIESPVQDTLEAQGSLFHPLLPNSSVVDLIIKRLTDALMNKELKPGQKIPTEMELSESLQVGRNSVREAIKVLVAMGVLEIRRSEGTFICNGFSDRMLDPMVYGMILDGGGSGNLIELRRIFDTGILQMIVEKADDQDIEILNGGIKQFQAVLESNPDENAIFDADMAFHNLLESRLSNPLVDKVMQVINRLNRPTRLLATREFLKNNELAELLELHQHIVKIIADHDSAAVSGVVEEHFKYWRHAANT